MIKRYSLLALILLLFCCNENEKKTVRTTLAAYSEPARQDTEQPFFQDLEGNAVFLRDFYGKRVLLNYWASWCRPCVEEMPSLLRLEEQLQGTNYILLLATNQSLATIEKFKAEKGYAFNYLQLHGSLAEQEVYALPLTVLYNEEGVVVERISGATEWDRPEMVQKLKKL